MSFIASRARLRRATSRFSTLDADLDGGIGQGVRGYRADITGWRLWWQRTCWICRNPAHGWQSELLGMQAFGTILLLQA
ncbi:DUF7338 family protein [Rhizobium bangladeshense]|uniref:DUF7338 family protein n=1 Tax=Rhizobium bangladeshense TaxID=1138189 RepID=UPI0040557AB2